MTLHHTKHHQTYVTALNAAEAQYAKASSPKERIALQSALKFNGGGTFAFMTYLLPRLIAIKDTSTTRSSGRTSRPHQRRAARAACSLRAPRSQRRSRRSSARSTSSRRSSTPRLWASRAQAGAGSYVSHSFPTSPKPFIFLEPDRI